MKKGNLIIISSPSGGGKGTLIKEILKVVPNIGYSVSFTTRARRFGEKNGIDYFFVNRSEFNDLLELDEFLEFAEVHGNLYGTSLNQVKMKIDAGDDVVLEIDVQGARSVKQILPEAISIFILPPSFEVLRNRLQARATEKPADLELRLLNSFGEVRHVEDFEYVIVNDDIVQATADLQTVILAERLKRVRQTSAIQGILDSFDTTKISSLGE